MLEINLSVTVNQDTIEAINNLAAAIAGPVANAAVKSAIKPAEKKQEPAAAQDGFNEVVNDQQVPFAHSEPAAEEPAPAPAKEYTLEEIRNKVMSLSRQGAETKAKVKAALNKYADSVPHLKKADYAAFMADLEVI